MPEFDLESEHDLQVMTKALQKKKEVLKSQSVENRKKLKKVQDILSALDDSPKEDDPNSFTQGEVDQIVLSFIEDEPKSKDEIWEHLKKHQEKHQKGGKALYGRFMGTLSPKNKRVKKLSNGTYTHKDKPRVAVKNGPRG